MSFTVLFLPGIFLFQQIIEAIVLTQDVDDS
jgi:hypothetical protein